MVIHLAFKGGWGDERDLVLLHTLNMVYFLSILQLMQQQAIVTANPNYIANPMTAALATAQMNHFNAAATMNGFTAIPPGSEPFILHSPSRESPQVSGLCKYEFCFSSKQ